MKKYKPTPSRRHKSKVNMALVVFAILGLILTPIGAKATGLADATAPAPTQTEPASSAAPDISWLAGTSDPASLASDQSLAILAGKLIFHGLVDAGACSDGGLMNNGYGSPCGERIARKAVILWQNQFDEAILQAADQSQIPPYLLKNVIARESQFWPARHLTIYGYYEYGLGHVTQMGADTLLRWNPDFYNAFCRQVYSDQTCKTSYSWQPANQQATLRGAVLQVMDANCEGCRGGIDLQRARSSIQVIAAVIKANNNHLEWLLQGFSSAAPKRVFEGSDLWRLTISSYNAGPGCVTTAATSAVAQRLKLNWKNISAQFDQGCEGALAYIDQVSETHPASPQALEAANLDNSKAAQMVFAGLGKTPPVPTAIPTEAIPSVTATKPETGLKPEKLPPTATPTSVPITLTPEGPSATPTTLATPGASPSASPEGVTGTPEGITVTPESGSETPTPAIPGASLSATSEIGSETPTSIITTVAGSETPTETNLTATATIESATPGASPEALTSTPEAITESPTPELQTGVPAVGTETETPAVSPTATETLNPSPTPTATPAPGEQSEEVLVKFRALVPEFIGNAAISAAGGKVSRRLEALGLAVVKAPAGKAKGLLEALQHNLLVSYAELNHTGKVMYVPNDPGFAGQGNLLDLHVPQAWDLVQGEGAVVAVIDTGIDATHPDLASNLWINPGENGTDPSGADRRNNGVDDDKNGYVDDWQGWNFVNSNNDVSDLNGHGTLSAGIIAARMDNNEGIAGVAPLARIMPLKAVNDSGYGTYADIASAIIYAVDHGAEIINLGFGGTEKSQVLQSATDYAYSHGVTVIAAAGNTGSNGVLYPAADTNVIAVSALDGSLNLAAFSSYGDQIGITAPGVGIYSTTPGGQYVQKDGTSMAAAEVSGIAALLVSQGRFVTPDAIRAALYGTALDLGDPGVDIYSGHGLAQAGEALNFTGPVPTSVVTETATPGATPTSEASGGTTMVDAPGANISRYAVSCSSVPYTSALGGTAPSTTINVNEGLSNAINLGFDFWYMGTRYTQVYASSNGWLNFTNSNSFPSNNLTSSAGRPFIAPLWDDLDGTNGTATYSTSGIAPNRTFTFEWWNWRWANSAPNISFKVILYESTGAIQYIYAPTGGFTSVPSASIGLSASSAGSGTFLSAQNTSACPTFSITTENANLNTIPPAAGTSWTFTPARPAAPTSLTLNNLSLLTTSATLNWVDNSNSELIFAVYNSTDNAVWDYLGTAPANSGTFNATNLVSGRNYFWRVYAVSEGGTSPMVSVDPPGSLTFTNVTENSMTVNWADTSSNESGYIIYRSTDGYNFSLMTSVGANVTSYDALALTQNTTYFWRVMTVGASTISAAAAGSQTTPFASSLPPTVKIISPTSGATFIEGNNISFLGSAKIPTNGDISSKLVWYMDGATQIGPGGPAFTLNDLAPGAHSITARVTDDFGRTASDSITINITANPSPHDSFNGSTEQCAICHRTHAAVQATNLLNSTLAPNDLCLSCHASSAKIVSTHSNIDWVGAGTPNPSLEAPFELECIQCHNPHGLDTKSTNLNNIRTNVFLTGANTPTTGPVTFTAISGTNSFDDGGPAANQICVTCHANAANPGFPMSQHPGGAGHNGGSINYSGLDCTKCHSHSLDSNPASRDGFVTSCRACHSQELTRTSAPGTRRQIVSNLVTGVNGGDFKRSSHHINDNLTDADCLECHDVSQHEQGRVRLKNADNPSTVYQLDYTFTPNTPTQADANNYEAFCSSCHDGNGASGNTTPFSDGKLVPSITGLWASARHNLTVGTFLGSCLDCHDNGHGSNKLKLLAPSNYIASTSPDAMQQEEKFCFACHTTSPGRPVAAAFNTWTNTVTRFFEHDVSMDTGLDHGKEVFSTSFGGSNRHIECGDCHDSHKDAYPNSATAPAIKSSQRGATGVEPNYNGVGTPSNYAFLGQATNEYQVCFKCHSSYTTLPNYIPDGWGCTRGTSSNPCIPNYAVDGLRKLTGTANKQVQDTRDLAKAFNPNNASFHPVLATGKNTNMTAASFVPGWGVNSMVYCSDCHTNGTPNTGGPGPHGSPLLHILDGSTTGDSNYSTLSAPFRNGQNTVPSTEICFKCHQYSVYVNTLDASNTHFRSGTNNLHVKHMAKGQYTATTCYTCHNSHGGNNLHLINFDTSIVTPLNGYTSETAWQWDGTSGSCTISCHGYDHEPATYTP